MPKEGLRSYRLNSMEEPTDEMLEAIMIGVQETARQFRASADEETITIYRIDIKQ